MKELNKDPGKDLLSQAEQEFRLQQAHALLAAGQVAAAQALFEALPVSADACNGMGLCAEARGQLSEAEVLYRQALRLQPEASEVLNNLAICLLRQGHMEAGLAIFDSLIQLQPPPEVLFNLALTLGGLGQPWEALAILRQTLCGQAPVELAVQLLVELMERLGQSDQTLARLQTLLSQMPEDPAYLLASAVWYEARGLNDMAVRYFRAALRANPSLLGVYRPLIRQLQSRGQYGLALQQARQLFTRELSLASLVQMINALQAPIPSSQAHVLELRQELMQWLETFTQPEILSGLLPGSEVYRPATLPFYHAYQGGDDRLLQERLAVFFTALLQGSTRLPANARHPGKPRLGIVSVHFYKHSVMDLLLRAIQTLLQSGCFEVFFFYYAVGQTHKSDQVTRQLQEQAEHFLELPDSVQQGRRLIAEKQLDLLMYLDIGMDSYTYALALSRLARHQLVLLGHPLTTGMVTIDYYLSAAAIESAGADTFYTETLIRLPGMPDYPAPVRPMALTPTELGLPEGHLYFCPMTLFKIQPALDAVLARILSLDPEGWILLFEHKNQGHLQLLERFRRKYGNLAGRLIFLPPSDQQRFFQRLLAADVILDTFPFGGGNTSYQALGLGCPMVCLDVPWQKGRWTQAMYHLMGIEGLVAADAEDYAQLAVRVASDKAWQADLREQIRERSRVLFDNPTWSQALLDFCLQLTALEGTYEREHEGRQI